MIVLAETNSFRFGLRVWGAGTDTFSRLELNDAFAKIEDRGAIDKQDIFASRPAAGVRGTYFWDTTNSYLWRDNGSAWFNVGSRTQDTIVRSSVIGNVPFTIDSPSGQTANLFELKVNAVTRAFIDKDGGISGGTLATDRHAIVNVTAASAALTVKGAAAQVGNLFEVKDSANANQFVLSPLGAVTSTYLKTGTTSVINASTATNVANMSPWSGTPVTEIRATGAAAFNDFVYLKHDTAAASAASRRLGFVMKVGAEDVTGAGTSAALYIQSDAASFADTALKIDVRNTNMWVMDPVNGSVTVQPVHANGSFLRATPSSTGGLRVAETWLGAQSSGNNQYFRVGTTGSTFSWYAGGVHSASAGAPGAGGITLASLASTGSAGIFTTGSVGVDSATAVSAVQSSPALRVGPANSTNVIFDGTGVLARNNGVVSELKLNAAGGLVTVNGFDAHRGETIQTTVSFSNKLSHTFTIPFDHTYAVAPNVHVNINSSNGEVSEWIASAYGVTTTGATIWVRSATNDLNSWSNIPVQITVATHTP